MNFDGPPTMLSEDHKPNLPEEADRITAAGGEVLNVNGIWRGGGTLAVSRAFGDSVRLITQGRNYSRRTTCSDSSQC